MHLVKRDEAVCLFVWSAEHYTLLADAQPVHSASHTGLEWSSPGRDSSLERRVQSVQRGSALPVTGVLQCEDKSRLFWSLRVKVGNFQRRSS